MAIALPARPDVVAKADLQIQGSSLALVDTIVTAQLGTTAFVHTSFGGLQDDQVPVIDGLSAAGDLVGPGITTPIPFTTQPGHAFLITGLSQEGTYYLQNVRLLAKGQLQQLASPSTAAIQVTNALQTTVTVRQLTPDELRARGITVDPSNYDVYEYTFSFLVDGKTVSIPYPVIINKTTHEIEPLTREDPYNLPSDTSQLPPRWAPPGGGNIIITPDFLDFGSTPSQSDSDPRNERPKPQIHCAIVIPNSLAVLHQFFAVGLIVANGAPAGSNVTLDSIGATIDVPNQLRVANVAPPTAFGQPVTITDPNTGATFLIAQNSGKAEWTLEGLKPGTYTVNLDVKATFKSLGQPDVPLESRPQATVIVHDARFNITFSHPDMIRKNLPYSTYTYITNISDAAQTITLSDQGLPTCSSGGYLANVCRVDTSPSSYSLTIQPGETKSVQYELQSSLTGHIYATAASIDGDSSVINSAQFQLVMGVSPTGVPLSPATLILPYYAKTPYFSQNLLDAELGYLGVAYSLATSPLNSQTAKFPRLITTDVFTRAVDLARAGERIFIGEDPRASLSNFMLDSLGNATALNEWDQFMRQEAVDPAGDIARTLESAVGAELSTAFSQADGTFHDMADRFAGSTTDRGPYLFALAHGAKGSSFDVKISNASGQVLDVDASQSSGWKRGIAFGGLYPLSGSAESGTLAVIGRSSEALDLTVTGGAGTLDLIFPAADGTTLTRASATFSLAAGQAVHVHIANGVATSSEVTFSAHTVPLAPISIVAARQDTYLDQDGHVVSVLFNRRLPANANDMAGNFDTDITLDQSKFGVSYTGKRTIAGAALQTDQRIIRLNYDNALSSDAQYLIHTSNLVDPSSNATVIPGVDVRNSALLYGTVLNGDNTIVAGAQLQLTTGTGIQYQVSDAAGHFLFEYIPRDPDNGLNGNYEITATANGRQTIVDGTVRLLHTLTQISVVFVGRGSAQGTVRYSDGTPVPNPTVVVGSTLFHQFRTATTKSDGTYSVTDLPVGPLTFSAQDAAGNTAYAANELRAGGQIVMQDISIYKQPFPGIATVYGRVVRNDTHDPVAGARVGVYSQGYGFSELLTDATGTFSFSKVPAGFVTVLAANFGISPTEVAVDFDLKAGESHNMGDLQLVIPQAGTVLVSVDGDVTAEDPLNTGVFKPVPNAQVQIHNMPVIVADAQGHYHYDSVLQTASGTEIFAYDAASGRGAKLNLPDLQPPSPTTPTNIVPIKIANSSGSGKGTIRVHLLSASGQPVDGYHVFWSNTASMFDAAPIGAGVYEFQNLAVGTTLPIQATPQGGTDPNYGSQTASGSGTVQFAGQIAAITLHLKGQGTVTANVQQATQAGVYVKIAAKLALTYNVWSDTEQDYVPHTFYANTDGTTDAVFLHVPVEGALLETVDSAGYASTSVTVGYDGAVVSKTLTLSTLAEVRGHVFAPDGYTPVAGASAHLLDGAQDLGIAITGVDGSFDYKNLVPSSGFTVTADYTVNGIYRTGIATGTTPAMGGIVDNVAIILEQQGSVEGTVVDASNAPVPFAKIWLRELSYPSRSLGTATDPRFTDANGHFRFNNIFAVGVRVSAEDPNNPDSRGDWSGAVQKENDVQTANITLSSTGLGSVRITVLDPNNALAPVPNTEVSLYRRGNLFDFGTTDATGSIEFDSLPVDGSNDYTASAFSKTQFKSGVSGAFAITKDSVASVSITLTFSGEVSGTLTDPQNNNAPVPGSNVNLFGSFLKLNYQTRTTTGTDGSYDFKGVREGDFTLEARDPNSIRMARGQGLVSSVYPTATIPLTLEPTSTLTVKAFLPNDSGQSSGVLAPLVSIDVTENTQGGKYLRSSQTNGDAFPGLVRGNGIDVTIHELGGLSRVIKTSTSFDANTAAKELDVVFSATGSVNVTVQSGSPASPAANVQVTAGSGTVSRSGYTDANGFVSLSDLPLGTVSIQAILTGTSPLSGSTSVQLNSQSTPATATILLGSYGGITGKVFAEGTTSPSAGTLVLANFGSTQLQTRTDATGTYTFRGIAVPPAGLSVRLTYVGPDDSTIGAQQTVTLQSGQGTVPAPDITLDSTPPRLIGIFPADGAQKVAPDTQLKFTFSRPVRNDQLTSGGGGYFHIFEGVSGTELTLVLASAVIQPDNSEIITFSPPVKPPTQSFPLKSNTLYRLLISGSLQDLANHFLGADLGASFTTSDYSAPQVTKVDPSPKVPLPKNGIQIGITFSKPLSPTPWQAGGSGSMKFTQITAIGGQPIGSDIPGNVQLDPITGAKLTYAPDVALTPAAFYRITLSGVVDTDGRAMVDANGNTLPVYTQDFFTYDTAAPVVTINNPAINGTAIGDTDPLFFNVLYTISVTLKNPDGSAVTDLDHVDFYSVNEAGTITPITRSSPTSVSIAVPAGTTSFALRADAWDLSLNKGTVSRTWTVSSQPQLTINSTTIAPATVFPGGSVTDTVKIGGGGLDANVVVTATQDGNPTPLATASASISRKLFTDPWPDAALALTIPRSVAGGSKVNLITTVSDIRGNSATPKTDVLTLATDSTAPVSQPITIQIVKSTVSGSPSNTFNNGDQYIVHGFASDADTGVASMTFTVGTATYAVTAGQSGSTFHSSTSTWEFVSPTITVQSHNNDLAIAINAKAADYAGNTSSASASVTYLGIHDPNAPNVAWIAPLHDAAWPAAATINVKLRVFASSPLPLAGTFDVPGLGSVAATRNGNELDATLSNFTTPAAGTAFQIVAHVNDGDGGHVIDLPINVDLVTTGQTIPSGGTIAVDATHPLNSDSIVVDGGRLVVYIPLTLKNLIVINGGLVDTVPSTTSADHKIDLTITDHLYVDDASSIDTSRRGYLGGLEPNADGSGSNTSTNGMTLGRTTTGGATSGASGSFGGVGGDDAGTTNVTYGSISAPSDFGSGGAADSSTRRGGQGGGSAVIHTDGTGLGNVVIAGSLLADGESGVNIGGAGSGGSIHISATQIVLGAFSKVSVSGGDDDGSASATRAGGGGRISLEATKLVDIDASNGTRVFALGGRNNASEIAGVLDGGAGTIFLRNPGETNGELLISALDPRFPTTAHLTRSTPLGGTLNFDKLTLGPRVLARADAALTINGITDDKAKATIDPSAVLLLQSDVPTLTIGTNPPANSSIIQGTSIGLTYTATSPAGVGSVTYALAPAVAAHSDTFPYTIAPAQQTPTIVVPGTAPTGSASLTVHLIDRAGRTADATPVNFTIVANQAPLITDFTVTAPSPFYIGNTISTSISATDDVAVKTISLTSQIGTASPSTQSATVNATPATQSFTVAIPKDATLDGKTVTLTATVADGVAAPVVSLPKTVNIAHDGNPPSIAISQPNAHTQPYTVDSGVLIHVVATVFDAESGVNPSTITASIPGSPSKVMTPTANPNEYAADLAIPFEPGTQTVTVNVAVTASDYTGNPQSSTAPVQITPHYDPSAPIVTWNCAASGALVPPGVPVTLSVTAVPGANNVTVQSVTFNDGTNNFTATKSGNVYSYNYTIPAGTPDGTVITLLASALTSGQGTGTAQTQITAVVVDKTISANTTINNGDLTYDFQNVAITGGTTTIIGHHEFKKLIVINGATLTQSQTTSANANPVDVKATAVYVACGSAIDVTGKGYGIQQSYSSSVSTNGSGGSHIGLGTAGNGGVVAAVYGSVEQPREAGAGSGGSSSGANGGGVVRIDSTNVLNDGAIRANGAAATNYGAGGSIWITTSTLGGIGTIEAKGICCGGYSSGSGGGAISVNYSTLAGGATLLNNAVANSSSGAGAGTVYVNGPSSTYGSLTVDDKGGTGVTQLPSLGNGTAQAGSTSNSLVTDYSVATAIPGYFVSHWVEVRDASGTLKGSWRIATINGKTVTLTPNGSETISVAPGDAWQGVYQFDTMSMPNGDSVSSVDPIRLGANGVLNITGPTTAGKYLQVMYPITDTTVTISGNVAVPGITAQSLTVTSGANLSTPTTNPPTALTLNVSGTLTVQSGGAIDVTGRGYGVQQSYSSSVSTNGSGGSHIGLGTAGNSGTVAAVYGSVEQPQEAGAGGGRDSGGANGGGIVRITAGTLVDSGAIRANGGSN
ncbi:MAG TPA: Ig-like domain-containing protein, partial [Thermoanaerobaculia bacterium]|nr:Ig-like domain-containing protein [Thermoanaerobaculia bacterium]